MKRLWQQYVARVDGATLRERAMIFGGAAIVMIALLNAALIEPELNKQRRLSQDVAKIQADTLTIQVQLQAMAQARQANPDQVNRQKLDTLRAQIAEADAQLKEEQRRFAPPERVAPILEEMLSRNRRIQLVDMRTLPVAAFARESGAEGATAKAPAAKPGAGGATLGPIYRHGIEVTLRGGYADLLNYLRELEKLPSQMYWGKMDLSVDAYPQVTLKLSVYTLSLDLAWLIV